MPDPQVLYVVTSVVVLALVAWVIAVLTRAGEVPVTAKSAAVSASGAPGGGAIARDLPEPPKTAPAAALPPTLASKSPPAPASSAAAAAVPSGAGMPSGSDVRIDVEEEEEPTGPHALILLSAVGRTDPGLKRKHNEDAYSIL
jgi:hypothetical protein